MQIRFLALVFLVLCVPVLLAQENPTLSGVVTDPGSPARFQVNGNEVLCTEGKTLTSRQEGSRLYGSTVCPQHFLGEQLEIYGVRDNRHLSIKADHLTAIPPKDLPVEGSALTDMVVSKADKQVVVRADGYLLYLTPDTKITYESTLKPNLDAVQTNQWIAYRGIAHPDGTVMVQKASLGPNVISDGEDQLRDKAEFDAATVSQDDRQSGVSKFFTGIDRTRIPAVDDPPLQTRLTTIGKRLIPAYQRALPQNDPSRIDFRFQLVEDSKYAYYALPSGIILVSKTIAVDDNDDQLAAVLATAIADVLQKQELRAQPVKRAMLLSGFAGDAAGIFLPGAGLATAITNQQVKSRMERRIMEQRSREALCLLHDAGFNLVQAPLAFWSMAQKQGKPLADTHMSDHVRYLYELLGTAWRSDDTPLYRLSRAQTGAPGKAGAL